MKRIFSFLLIFCLALGLAACGKQKSTGVTYPTEEALPCSIGRTALSPEAEVQPAPSDAVPFSQSYDFQARPEASAIKLILYRLENGAWEDAAGGSWEPLSEDGTGITSGKLTLRFSDLQDQVQITVLSGGRSRTLTLAPGLPAEGNTQVTFLTSRTDFSFLETVPLAVQVTSHQDRIFAPDLDIWKHPEAYAGQDYEQIWLLALSLKDAAGEP